MAKAQKLPLAPNGFPPAPAWAWSARVAVFPGDNIDGGNPALLDLTDAEIQARVEKFAARGVTLIQDAGFHARFMVIPLLDRITELNARITTAAHRCGMRVYDHHSSNGLWHAIEGTYRGWDPQTGVNVDIRTGLPLPKDKPKLICINNPDYQKHYDHYILDYIKKTGVDGLMYDDVHFHHGQYGCGCRYCREKFKTIFGYELPEPGQWPLDDYDNPIWRDWIRFRLISSGDRIVALRRKLPTDFFYFSCMSAGVASLDDAHHGGGSFEGFSRGTNCLFSECGSLSFRNEHSWDRNFFSNWEALYVEKKYHAGIADYHQQPALQMHYPANPDDGWFCWALTKCLGMNLWRCDTNMYGDPKYGDEFQEWEPQYDYFNWEARHEDLWRYGRPAAEIGLLFSFQTKINVGADQQPHGEEYSGWVQSLQRAGLFFDTLIDPDLEKPDRLSQLKLLILPNAVCLSDRQLKIIRDFVRGGGQLIATHRTACCDETGAPRPDFGLADLLGVHLATFPPTQRSSWSLDQRRIAHPFGAGLPPRLPLPRMLPISWDGESASRTAFGWLEKTRKSFEWPAVPAVVESRVGKGLALYLMPAAGQLAYREGLFPLWHTEPHLEKFTEDVRKGESTWIVVEPHNTPKNGRWLYVDESLPAYRQLIENAVRHALPLPRIQVAGLPDGVLCELRRLAPQPNDTSEHGDLLVSFLNLTGARLKHGEWAPRVAQPIYPPLEGKAVVTVREPGILRAQIFSPDLPKALDLAVAAVGETTEITIPLELVARVGFVRIQRGKKGMK